jgi:sulfur relay (sulfurtransferase) complex TusBCD TusD component (DsrE family)
MTDTCRDEILAAIHGLLQHSETDVFSVSDIVNEMRARGTSYQESTIRKHVTSRMCGNAPDHRGVVYSDLRRLDRGLYKLSPQMERRPG